MRLRKVAKEARAKSWHVAIGPYLWASSVDANVSLGPASVSSGVDFFEIQRHARYGAEVLAEARYGRFSIYSDLMYGVVDLEGAKEIGPLMVGLVGQILDLLNNNLGSTIASFSDDGKELIRAICPSSPLRRPPGSASSSTR